MRIKSFSFTSFLLCLGGLLLGLLLIVTLLVASTTRHRLTFAQHPTAPVPCSNGIPKGVQWQDYGSFAEQDAQDMQNAGIHWARVFWYQNGTGRSIPYDTLVQIANRHGINLTVTLIGIPGNDLGTPAQREAYKAWVSQLVNRYKASIHFWEINNEPNLFWNIDIDPKSDQTHYDASVARYVQLLHDSYTTIHAADPTAKVIIGGVSEYLAERYIDSLIKNEAYLYFDIMAFHPYQSTPQATVSRVNMLKSKMTTVPAFAAKPIWINEIGWHTPIPGSASYNEIPDEQTKANYLTQEMQLLRNDGVTLPVFWYMFRQGGTTSGFGLTIRTSATRVTYLPAYDAYKNLWAGQNNCLSPTLLATLSPS